MVSQQRQRLPRASIHERLAALTVADYRRLAALARARAWGWDIDAGDLLHEAVLRAYLTRSCAPDVNVIAFLSGIMRSLVSQHVRALTARLSVRGLWSDGHDTVEGGMATIDSFDSEAPERRLDLRQARLALSRATAGDPQLERLVDALSEGLIGHKLAARLAVDAAGLATAKRRLARRLRAVQSEFDIQRQDR